MAEHGGAFWGDRRVQVRATGRAPGTTILPAHVVVSWCHVPGFGNVK